MFTTDRRVIEKSKNAYLQWNNSWDDLRVPISLAAGVRYEETKVQAQALVPVAVGIDWVANNELPIRLSDSAFAGGSGKYKYWLPSLDLSFKLREDLVLRGSYGETIGRPGWGDIQGGQTLNQIGRIEGGSGQEGNPGLKPLLSHNIDLSLEWYYGEESYARWGSSARTSTTMSASPPATTPRWACTRRWAAPTGTRRWPMAAPPPS